MPAANSNMVLSRWVATEGEGDCRRCMRRGSGSPEGCASPFTSVYLLIQGRVVRRLVRIIEIELVAVGSFVHEEPVAPPAALTGADNEGENQLLRFPLLGTQQVIENN